MGFAFTRAQVIQLLNRGGPFWWKAAAWARPFDAAAVRKTLGWLKQEAARRRRAPAFDKVGQHFVPAATFLEVFVEPSLADDALVKRWRLALGHLDGLHAYALGSKKQKHQKLEAIAKDREALAAWQAAAVASGWLPNELLWLLVCDGGPESTDALMPHVERALRDEARLTQLNEARRFASPRAAPIFALVDARRSSALSPVRELGQRCGLERAGRVRLRLRVPAVAQPRHETLWLGFELDSDSHPAHSLWVATQRRTTTSFSERSELVPHKSLAAVPAAIANTARRLGVEWNFAAARPTFVKRSECAALIAWLEGR